MAMTDAQINRMIAKMATRNCYKRRQTSPAELMAEAHLTDKFWCSESEMAKLLAAELSRVNGQTLGGFVSAAKRRYS